MSKASVSTRYGWSRAERKEELKKLLDNPSKATFRIIFKDQITDLKIIRVPINLPKYRLANGRTISLQAEYLAKNPTARKDLFSKDPELWDSQEAQHKLLLDLAKSDGSNLREYFQDTSRKQTDALLLDENGFVINGNRRLAMWRSLNEKESKKYSHFNHIDVSVLPHCDEKEIDRLEAILQIEKDIKADYSWDSQANMFIEKMNRHKFTTQELSKIYKIKESEIQKLLDMRNYAYEYLKSRGKQDLWSEVSKEEYAFEEIVNGRKKIESVAKQEFFKQSAFALLDKPEEAGGRLYQAIPSILNYLDKINHELSNTFKISSRVKKGGLRDMFGSAKATSEGHDIRLVEEISKKENIDKAREIIVEVIKSQKEQEKDSKSANYLLDQCSRAAGILSATVSNGLRPECLKPGIQLQVTEIEKHLDAIKKFIKKK